ncbi:MAG: hypothetical protein LUP97_02940 [Methanoregula sp.]|nr:hypothetical protein [Methanoregula sp.]
MQSYNRGAPRSGRKRWAIVGAIIGLFVLVAGFVIFTHEATGDPAAASLPPVPAVVTPSGQTGMQGAQVHYGVIDPKIIPIPRNITVPSTGSYIVVWYPGAFSGVWQADNQSHEIQSSGHNLYSIENTGQEVSAVFRKIDESVKQTLTVELWKDGRVLASESTKALFGEIRVSGRV